MDVRDGRSLPELLSSLTWDLADLVRNEAKLVRTEFGEKLDLIARSGALLGLGTALLIGAFLLLLQAAVLGLSKVMDPLWATVLVGAVTGLAGLLVVRGAAHRVRSTEIMPDRTARQLDKDAALVKGHMK